MAIPFVVNSMFSGTQWVIVREVVSADAFVLGRSTMNLAGGVMQIAGYALGGLALLWSSPRGLFVMAAVGSLAALVNVRCGLRDRPARRVGDRNVARRTLAENRRLLASPSTRPLYLAVWIPSALVVGSEALFIPYGGGAGGGLLLAASAVGMLAGDLLVGRFVPPLLRDRLIGPLRLLQALPYLGFLLPLPVELVASLVAVSSVGFAAELPVQDRLLRRTDSAIHGQAMGLLGQGAMVSQAIGAFAAGLLAAHLPVARVIGGLAVLAVVVAVFQMRGLRRSATDSAPRSAVGSSRRAAG